MYDLPKGSNVSKIGTIISHIVKIYQHIPQIYWQWLFTDLLANYSLIETVSCCCSHGEDVGPMMMCIKYHHAYHVYYAHDTPQNMNCSVCI